jgi:hypothetical protein
MLLQGLVLWIVVSLLAGAGLGLVAVRLKDWRTKNGVKRKLVKGPDGTPAAGRAWAEGGPLVDVAILVARGMGW